ncbi:MAG: hypothetical protein RIC89_02275 [Pseudomonadales bacterium]
MRTRYLIRFLLLTVGFALTTFGILAWQKIGFDLRGVWPDSTAGLQSHPIYILILGMALIPPTLWEIFLLEQRAAQSPTEDAAERRE